MLMVAGLPAVGRASKKGGTGRRCGREKRGHRLRGYLGHPM